MLKNLSFLVLICVLVSPGTVFSQEKFKAKRITPNAVIAETAVSNDGNFLATISDRKKGMEILQLVDVRTSKALQTFPYDSFNVNQLSPIAVSDGGIILATGGVVDFSGASSDPVRCSVFKIDAINRSFEVLVSYESSSGCTSRRYLGDQDVSGAINGSGDVFLVYYDSDEKTRVYEYFSNDDVTRVMTQDFPDFGGLPPVHVTEDGEVQSVVSPSGEAPGQLMFYSPENGLSLHALPEEVQFRPIVDFSGNHYLFLNSSVGLFVTDKPYELYTYTIESSRDSGTLTLTNSQDVIKNLRKKNKEILKKSDVYAYRITESGALYGEIFGSKIKKGKSINYNQVFLHSDKRTRLLFNESRGFSGKTKKARLKKFVHVTEARADNTFFAFVSRKFGNGSVVRLAPRK